MKTRLLKGALCLPLALAGLAGCKTKPYCEELGNCGGDMLAGATDIWKLDGLIDREWIATSTSACQDQLQIPPAPLSLLRQPPVTATQRPPDTVTADWCSNLVLKPDGEVQRFIVYAPPVPLKVGQFSLEADYDGSVQRGTYAMQITWDQTRSVDFSETCMTSQGIRPTCPELGRHLGDFLASEANIYSVRCSDPPAPTGGCHCDFELSFIGGPNGRWALDPNNPGQITFFDDSFAAPTVADYCVKPGGALDLTGHDDAALFNQKSLRTLSLAAPTCSDGVQSRTLEEEGVDCGGQCPNACGTCSDGMQNGDETGIDCGGSCLGSFCDPDPTITDPKMRHAACANNKRDPWEEGIDCGGFCKNSDGTDALCCTGADNVAKRCCQDSAGKNIPCPTK
jgi:hypothetical protein